MEENVRANIRSSRARHRIVTTHHTTPHNDSSYDRSFSPSVKKSSIGSMRSHAHDLFLISHGYYSHIVFYYKNKK